MYPSGEQQIYHSWRESQQLQIANGKSSNATRSPLCSLSALCSNAFSAIATSATTCFSARTKSNRKHSGDDEDEVATTGVTITNGHYTETVVRRSTPILFSTNRGLHLRVAKPRTQAEDDQCTSRARWCASSAYDIQFCDLERWNTRANAVSLEDTFTILKPQTALYGSIITQQSAESTIS